MQNTPPVARGGLLWALKAELRHRRRPRRRDPQNGPDSISSAIVNVHEGEHERWLEELDADPAPVPLRDRAQPLLNLGVKVDRAAEILGVGVEELLRAVPRVHARVLLPSSAVYTLSPAQRLRLEDW